MTIARRTERMLKRSKRVKVMGDLPSLAEAMKPRIPVKRKTSPPMIPSPYDHSYLNIDIISIMNNELVQDNQVNLEQHILLDYDYLYSFTSTNII